MSLLNLKANTPEQQKVKEYLEQNASDVLVDKINNGVKTEKDGKTLINKKDLDGFMEYAYEKARKLAKGANCACISADTVFGWANHYFEEDSIEGTLYTEDGEVYKKPSYAKSVTNTAPKEKPKKEKPKKAPPAEPSNQFSLFDMFG